MKVVRVSSLKFTAPYQARRFPTDVIAKAGSVTFTADDLAHALFATGRAPGDRRAHGAASMWEWIHRTTLIPAYIRRTLGGELTRSQLAQELDRSEKVGVSYAIGQALTGIFCEQLLSTPLLLHIDRYARHFNVTFNTARKRADLFGPYEPGGWTVAEAKGRSNAIGSDLNAKLADQKRSVATIAGSAPTLALGCVASFPPRTSTLMINAFDPDKDEIEAFHLDVNIDRYFLAYYAPFVTAIDFGNAETALEDSEIIYATLPLAGLRIGILRSIADRVRAASQGDIAGLADSIRSLLEQSTPFAGFPDGTIVETNWDASLTIRDWEK